MCVKLQRERERERASMHGATRTTRKKREIRVRRIRRRIRGSAGQEWWKQGREMGHTTSAMSPNVVDTSGVELSAEEKLNALRNAVDGYVHSSPSSSSAMQTDTEDQKQKDSSLENIRRALNAITSLEDVGLSLDRVQRAIQRSSGPYQQMGSKPMILYRGLHEDERFSLGVFCIPDGGVIPLHDHPGMTVVSKMIHGEMRVRSFDFQEDEKEEESASSSSSPFHANERAAANAMHARGGRRAQRVNDSCVSAGDVLALFPKHGGNVHEFTGVAGPAVVIDVLTPPYAPGNGRDCTYYEAIEMEDDVDDDNGEDTEMTTPVPSSVFVDLAPDGSTVSTPASDSSKKKKKKKNALLLRACNEPDWFACYDIDQIPI